MVFRNKIIYLIAASSLLRLLVAGTTELGNDEVYYYTYALHLQWNYFDHPPGVALLIKLCTLNLWLTSELFVRLGALLCAAIGTELSYAIGKQIKNERTGWYAAVLYNTSLYTSIIAGIFILPDSPQVVCWLAALLLLIKMVRQLNDDKQISTAQWLLFGAISGICIQCKVHGVFLWFGFGLYVLLYKIKTLLQPGLYVSFFITLLIISPIVLWNINNHFITFTYHSNRVAVHRFSINFSSFLQAFFGQILYNNPINVFIAMMAIFHFKTKRFLQPFAYRILVVTGLPIVIVVTLMSLFNSVLPHWSGPGFLSLSFIGAAYLDAVHIKSRSSLPVIIKSSAWLIVVAVIAGMATICFYPGTIGSKKENDYGSGDFTLDLSGWKDFEHQYNNWLQNDGSKYKHLAMVCNKWFPASHIEYYIAQPTHTKVIGVGSLDDLHNFAWLNKVRTDLKTGEDALCIVPSNYATDVAATYNNTFSFITKLQTFAAVRSGKTTRYFTVYLLHYYTPTDEAHRIILQ